MMKIINPCTLPSMEAQGENGPTGPDPAIYMDSVTGEIIDRFEEMVENQVYAGLKTNIALSEAGKLAIDECAKTPAEAAEQVLGVLGREYTDVFVDLITTSYQRTSTFDRSLTPAMTERFIKSHS